MAGWIGVDLDGTLAHYEGWKGGQIGEPIPAMVHRIRCWLQEGKEVRIFTARVCRMQTTEFLREQEQSIKEWCVLHIGIVLPVTSEKDFGMIELWDDRCVRVRINTGEPCCESV